MLGVLIAMVYEFRTGGSCSSSGQEWAPATFNDLLVLSGGNTHASGF